MTKIEKTYANLSAGEIDAARLAGREDLSYYERGLKSGRNVVSVPTGGFRDRGGFLHVDQVRNQLQSLAVSGATVTVPSGTVSKTTDAYGEPCVKTTAAITVPGGGGAVVTVDFGAAQTVGLVDFFGFAFSGAAAQDAWRVEYSTDNVEWTAFGDDFDADGTQSRRASLAPGQSVSARYWRVRALAALDGRTLTFDALVFWQETASVSAAKLYGFAYDTEATYLMVQTDRNIEVYDAQVRKASIRAPHAHADVSVVNRAQSLDTLILFHEDYAPWRVQRYRDAGEWTADLVPLENIPLEQYSGETYFNGTNERQEVFMGGFTNGADRFNLMVGEDATEGILFSGGAVGGTGVTTAADIEDALEALDSVGVGNVTVTCNAANTFQIEFTNDKGQQPIAIMGYNFLGPGTGDEIMQVSRTQRGKRGGEDIVSATRGWPACGTFFQGRLVMAGLKARPATLLFSVLSDYFDFDQEPADGGLSLAIDSDQVKRIRQLHPGRHLLIFTDDSEHWIADRVIVKGSQISFAQASRRGVTAGLDILEVDDQVLFVQGDGEIVRAFGYSDGDQSYLSPNVSRLSPHLVRQPVDWTVRRGGGNEGAELAILANTDGQAAALAMMGDEQFLAWHPWETDGSFVSFGTEGLRDVFAVAERAADGVTTRRLEFYDEAILYDAAYTQTHGAPVTAQSGLSHLEGRTVELRLDGSYAGTAIVASAAVTLPQEATKVELGLPFTCDVEGMPLRDDRFGVLMDVPVRIHAVALSLLTTGALQVSANGSRYRDVPLRRFGDKALEDEDDDLFTGEVRVVGFAGYDRQATFRLRQPWRAPFHVRAVKIEGRSTK